MHQGLPWGTTDHDQKYYWREYLPSLLNSNHQPSFDFEAFLEPKVDVFIRVIREKWLDKDGGVIGYCRSDNESDMNIMKWDTIPKVADVITTPREVIEALNVEMV